MFAALKEFWFAKMRTVASMLRSLSGRPAAPEGFRSLSRGTTLPPAIGYPEDAHNEYRQRDGIQEDLQKLLV